MYIFIDLCYADSTDGTTVIYNKNKDEVLCKIKGK